MMKRLAILAALLLAAPASADLWVHGCTVSSANCTALNVPYDCCTGAGTGTCPISDATGIVGKTTIRSLERACWTFVTADIVGTDSPLFTTTGDTIMCYNHDLTADAAPGANADVTVFRCPDGSKPSTNPQNVCIDVIASTGSQGPAGDGCSAIQPPGVYYVEVTTRICAAGNICQFSVEGTDPQRQ
jgi:hypothetical protein